MKITMLGTGNALVTECYNTCFIMEEDGKYLLVDGGGGNEILRRLKKIGVGITDIRDIFVTHKHVDHIMGIIWMVRMICQNMVAGKYEGDATIYACQEVVDIIRDFSRQVLAGKQIKMIDSRLHFVVVEDGDVKNIIGHDVQFFDIMSTKATQFGFSMQMEDCKFVCCGDEPYNAECEKYVKGCKWLMHEAFCLYGEADEFKPYEKHHSTVKDACELAEGLGVENLIIYHTEDKNIKNRKEMYSDEGKKYYTGNLFVPDDFEVITVE